MALTTNEHRVRNPHHAAEPAAESVIPSHGDAVNVAPAKRAYFRFRDPCERLAAGLLLVLVSPLTLLLVVLVRMTSRGPAIFQQVRVGASGRHFKMYKIRSMVQNAESRTGPIWAIQNDPRLTRLGKLLRKLHLDELPQLWNVVKGDMSLVGPRPERPEFTHTLSLEIPRYLERLAVKPGITGLAQINLPPDTDLDSVRRKLVLDLEYIGTAGPWLDLRMLACTALRIVGLKGEIAMRLCCVRRHVEVPAELAAKSPLVVDRGASAVPAPKKAGHAVLAAADTNGRRRAK
jgi:lipopolysaccharide/colanic/teichoic acid biosynthesis glycosyltransferase